MEEAAAAVAGASRFLVYAPGVKRLLREPLVHFLALGAALFLFFAWRGGTGRIVVTRARIASLAAGSSARGSGLPRRRR